MLPNSRKKRKGNSQKISVAVGMIFILSILILLAVADVRVYKQKQELATQIESLKNSIQDTKNKNDSLKIAISKEGDSQYVEKVAREDLDMQKQGEKVVSFVPGSNQNEQVNQNSGNVFQYFLSWLAGWWHKSH